MDNLQESEGSWVPDGACEYLGMRTDDPTKINESKKA